LVQLGLNCTEARIFLALSNQEKATARTISMFSGIAREIVYQIMPSLEEKGLVEVILSTPKMFKSISKEKGYKILLKRKNAEEKKLRQRVNKAIRISEKNPITDSAESSSKEESLTMMLPPGEAQHAKIIKEWQECRTIADLVMDREVFLKWVNQFAEKQIRKSLGSGAKIRIIVGSNVPVENFTPSERIQLPAPADCLEVRYSSSTSLVAMGIFDNKRVLIDMEPNKSLLTTPVLWSNSSQIAQMSKTYFETLWSTASKSGKTNLITVHL
jgi:sugar-specific transcriptional regulator TrmB